MQKISHSIEDYKANRVDAMSRRQWIRQAAITAAIMLLAFGIGVIFRVTAMDETNIAIVYLLSVLLITRYTDAYIFGFISSFISAFSFNYFFTEPYYSLTIKTSNYIISFIIMTITTFVTSGLTAHAKADFLKAKEKEAESKLLYSLTARLNEAANSEEIAAIATATVSDIFHCKAACLAFDDQGRLENSFIQQVSSEKQVRREFEASHERLEAVKRGEEPLQLTEEFYDWPIWGREVLLGLIRIPSEDASNLSDTQRHMLRSIIENTALAMDRFRAIQDRLRSHDEIAQERYRGNLLRAISHDLRTPLASIMGTADMLRHMTDLNDPRYEHIEQIYKDANWLHALVENILGLTRLQDGRLVLNKQEEAVEEIVGAALRQFARRAPDRALDVHVPDELLLVPMDAKLISQVLINLLDNAHKHSEPQSVIHLTVDIERSESSPSSPSSPSSDSSLSNEARAWARFTVQDEGEGIAAVDLPHLFQMFYTAKGKQADSELGIGLGLAICQAIVEAHGGKITAENNEDGPGASLCFTLPLTIEKLALKPDIEAFEESDYGGN